MKSKGKSSGIMRPRIASTVAIAECSFSVLLPWRSAKTATPSRIQRLNPALSLSPARLLPAAPTETTRAPIEIVDEDAPGDLNPAEVLESFRHLLIGEAKTIDPVAYPAELLNSLIDETLSCGLTCSPVHSAWIRRSRPGVFSTALPS